MTPAPAINIPKSQLPIHQTPAISLTSLSLDVLRIIFKMLTWESEKALHLTCKRFHQILANDREIYQGWFKKDFKSLKTLYVNVKPAKDRNLRDKSRIIAAQKYFEEENHLDEKTPILQIRKEQKRLKLAKKYAEEELERQSCCSQTYTCALACLCCPCVVVTAGFFSLYYCFKYGECDLESPNAKRPDPHPLDK